MKEKVIKNNVKEIRIKIDGKNKVKYYNEKGLITRYDSGKPKTSFKVLYDNDDNVLRYDYDNGDVIKYNYDENGNEISYTIKNGKKGYKKYNEKGLLIEHTFVNGDKETFYYDEHDKVIKKLYMKDGEIIRTMSYEYDNKTLTAHIITTIGSKVKEEFITYHTAIGTNVKSYKNSKTGTDYNKKYNEMDSLVEIVDNVSGEIVTYEYDENGNLIKILSNKGYEKVYTRNESGKIINVKDNNGLNIIIEYNENGFKCYVEYTSPKGYTVEREYIYY